MIHFDHEAEKISIWTIFENFNEELLSFDCFIDFYYSRMNKFPQNERFNECFMNTKLFFQLFNFEGF